MISQSRGLLLLSGLFFTSLITSTLLGSKLILISGITLSVGIFIFPFTFLASELITEIYGPNSSRFLVKCGIFVQILVLFFVWLVGILPAHPNHDLSRAYADLFLLAPRMVLASIVAYTFSQFLDIEVFLRVKKATEGRHLWLRANVATYCSQAVDTFLFTLVFLGGVIPLRELAYTALTSYFVKVLFGTLDTPFIYLGIKGAQILDGHAAYLSPTLKITPLRTPTYSADQDLIAFLIQSLPEARIQDGTLIAITSKIVSLSEGAFVPRKTEAGSPEAKQEKLELIKKEADIYMAETVHQVSLTIKHGIFMPSAGIDESNSQDQSYILFPKDPYASAARIGRALRAHYQIKNLGIILTDSHTTPLRNGVIGIGLAHYGFKAVKSLIGKPDLFGREMKMTQINLLDALSVAAVLEMGETNDSCPLALIETNGIEFTDQSSASEVQIPIDQDLYGSFFKTLF